MKYLTQSDILLIHEILLERHGGKAGIRDLGLIEAALLRPQTGYYSDLIEEAAALCESLAMNHGYIDGNKRVAFAGMEIFLDINGITITATPDDVTRFVIGHLEANSFIKDNIENWLRANTGIV